MSDLITFAKNPQRDVRAAAGWKVIVVDDEPAVHAVTSLALREFEFDDRPLELISAYSGEQARRALDQNPDAAVILVDVVMETERSGLDLVRYIREDLANEQIRIVLRTGQPGEAPEHSVIRDYDINDYKEKTELTAQKLATVMYATLRAFRDIVRLKDLSEELRKSKAAIEVAERAKAAFVSTVGHELRTPLNAILGLSEFMIEEAHGPIGDTRYKDYIQDIHASGKTLLAMVENILDVTDDATGVVVLHDETFDLSATVEECLRKLRIRGGPNIDARRRPAKPIHIRADRIAVQRMLLALLTNALKFGATEGHYGISIQKADDGRLMLSILDDGPGLDDRDLEELTRPFARHEPSYIATNKGLGLGLAVAKLLIERHGGELKLQRRDEGGTRASLIFPSDRVIE
ncbi:MAG: hybrid sensor histidine kinase/response regulator [Alphaproteobacteria bacterium]